MSQPTFIFSPSGYTPVTAQVYDVAKPGANRPGQRILLVDDDPIVSNSLNDVLVEEGFFVMLAKNGLEALQVIKNSPVDLVLLDLNMPVKNGWDTLAEVRQNDPVLPVIVLTARPHQLSNAMNAGASALMEKPMDMLMLLQTINGLLLSPKTP